MIRCSICNQSYSRRDALQRHERNVHCSGKYTDQSQPLKEMTSRHPFSMMVTGAIDREYSQKWTGELFKIDTRFRREGVPVYTILDWDGERVDGTFYEPELQPLTIDPTTEYRVEEILKRRVRNKRKEVLVRWLHWPKKYDSWIPEADVKDYN